MNNSSVSRSNHSTRVLVSICFVILLCVVIALWFSKVNAANIVRRTVSMYLDEKQISYNKKLLALSQELTIPLIAGTDTHVLNEQHEKGRSILQASKNIFFDGEERWDLKFKTYDELVAAYRAQGSLPEAEYMQAIENTNLLANMV